jgi:hypothetical protein
MGRKSPDVANINADCVSPVNERGTMPMSEAVADVLRDLMAYRDLTLPDMLARHGLGFDQVKHHSKYIRLAGLARVYDRDAHPGRFYFHEADETFVLLYIEQPGRDYPQLTSPALRKYLGEPAAELPSRAGPQHVQSVYPEQGMAFSADQQEVSFLEIFQPTTLETYQAQFYMNPGTFIR